MTNFHYYFFHYLWGWEGSKREIVPNSLFPLFIFLNTSLTNKYRMKELKKVPTSPSNEWYLQNIAYLCWLFFQGMILPSSEKFVILLPLMVDRNNKTRINVILLFSISIQFWTHKVIEWNGVEEALLLPEFYKAIFLNFISITLFSLHKSCQAWV